MLFNKRNRLKPYDIQNMFCIKNKGFFSHKTYRKEILIEYLQCKIYIFKKAEYSVNTNS